MSNTEFLFFLETLSLSSCGIRHKIRGYRTATRSIRSSIIIEAVKLDALIEGTSYTAASICKVD